MVRVKTLLYQLGSGRHSGCDYVKIKGIHLRIKM